MNLDWEPIPLTPIAEIRSCYHDRFGIPRQAGLVTTATATIVMPATEANKLSLRGLEQSSHIWVIFLFHQQAYGQPKPLVRPPRLGGKKAVGVYATRSPNRPNPIGLSAVPLTGIEAKAHELWLHIQGGDFLDGTPVLDIKPYVPYADAIAATSPWPAPSPLPVTWTAAATAVLAAHAAPEMTTLQQLISETIAQDPRPAHERGKDGRPGQKWGMEIDRFDVIWQVMDGTAIVTKLTVRSKSEQQRGI